MTDNIKFPPLPVSANFYGMYGEYTKSQVEALMREAVRLNAQAVPVGAIKRAIEALTYCEAPNRNIEHQKLRSLNELHNILSAAPAAPQPAQQPLTDDPCPGCQVGTVCRTPKCGRLKLPADHPLRTGVKND